MRKIEWSVWFLLAFSGCSGGEPVDTDATVSVPAFELDSCEMTGGSFGDGQCYFAWFCEPGNFEVRCAPVEGRETCECFNDESLVSSFVVDTIGDYCETLNDGGFDQRTVERCGFPDGPSEGPETVSASCDGTSVRIEMGYVGTVTRASFDMFDTAASPVTFDDLSSHDLDVELGGTTVTPRATFSATIPRQGDGSTPLTCDAFNNETVTYVLKAFESENSVFCAVFGHNPTGVKEVSVFDEEIRETIGADFFDGCTVFTL